jgi:membrane protein DedA with SNARE-associated domain
MHALFLTLAAHLSVIASVFSFFSNILNNVETAFRHYGYLIVFLPILGESAGIPLPGETVLLAGGLAASKGILSLPLVILVGASAAIVGDNLGYLVGRAGGRPLLFRYGRVLHVKDRQLAILDSFFERHGPKTVFFGRWVIFLRVWAALFAGASRMHWRQFGFWNALGGLAWATTMGTLAYVFAASVVRISKVFGIVAWVLAIAVGIAVAIFINRMQKRAENRQQVDRAEERIRLERVEWEQRRAARKAQRQS